MHTILLLLYLIILSTGIRVHPAVTKLPVFRRLYAKLPQELRKRFERHVLEHLRGQVRNSVRASAFVMLTA